MGTGVGEAMLIGAAVGATAGGAGAAIQGGDPLQGALTGGAMGAVGGGLGAGFGAAGGATAGGTSGATAGGTSGAVAGGTSGAVTPGVLSTTGGAGFGTLGGAGTGAVGGGTLGGTAGGGTFGTLGGASTGAVGGGAGFGGIGAASGGAGFGAAGYTPGMYASGTASMPGGVASLPGNFTGYAPELSNTKLGLIGGSSLLSGMMQAERDQFGVPALEDYESSFDPSKFKRSEPTYAPEGIYRPEYKDYTTAAEGGIMRLANGGPVERMSMANTAMNPQGGLYPMGMIDKTQYATPTQRPVSAELVGEAPAYERSNPMLMAGGGQVKGYAAGGMPDFGNGYNPFANLPELKGPLGAVGEGQRPAGMQPMGSAELPPGFNPFRNHIASSINTTTQEDIMGGDRRVNPSSFSEIMSGGILGRLGASLPQPGTAGTTTVTRDQFGQPHVEFNQSTGQSTFPGAGSMQGGFGQGAQGYPSFAMGSGSGSGGPFPLEGQYGIVRMNTGGIAGVLEAAKAQGLTPEAYQQIYGRGNAIIEMQKRLKEGQGMASGGISSLGSYSDGGRMLKGPGDGMSDSIPGVIANKQPARLADGEFVVPADVVSHLGNGSTDAGAKQLYSMMDKVRKARTGKKSQGKQINPNRYMPA